MHFLPKINEYLLFSTKEYIVQEPTKDTLINPWVHRGQPIDCPERNSSIAPQIYLDISTRFFKYLFAKSVLSHNPDTYLQVTRCHQLLEGISLVNHQSRNIDRRFRNDFGGVTRLPTP